MSGHTPGPWRAFAQGDNTRHIIEDAGKNDLAYVIDRGYAGSHHVRAANARLIAAAPRLLAALRAVVAIYDKVGGPLAVDPAVADARAAIAEAEGR